MKIHASLTQRCLGVSWALPQPVAPPSNGTLRDVGLFEDLLEATYPNLHVSKGIHGLISAQREEPARHIHRQRHGREVLQGVVAKPKVIPSALGPGLSERTLNVVRTDVYRYFYNYIMLPWTGKPCSGRATLRCRAAAVQEPASPLQG